MKDEKHRAYALEAYNAYTQKTLNIETVKPSITELDQIAKGGVGPFTYILRLNKDCQVCPAIAAIPNRNDPNLILYIGGTNSNQKIVRPKSLVKSCESAMATFRGEGYAINDQPFGHTVGGALTTSLLENGFTLDNCLLDIIDGNGKYNELEFLIGYEETHFHLPPWNGSRTGMSLYVA
jgi:hypothetical protein